MEVQADDVNVVIDDERADLEVVDYAKDHDHHKCEVHKDHVGLRIIDFGRETLGLSLSRKLAADVWAELGETLTVDHKAAALDRTQRRLQWVADFEANDISWAKTPTIAEERGSIDQPNFAVPMMVAVLTQYRLVAGHHHDDAEAVNFFSTRFRAALFPSALLVVESDDGVITKLDCAPDPEGIQIPIHDLLCSCESSHGGTFS